MVEKAGTFDVAVIGSGPGGYVAAIRAGQLGLRTAIIEKDPRPGGTCLHRGCIPTKALLMTAHVLDTARESQEFGVVCDRPRLDLPGAMRYKESVVGTNATGVEVLLKKNKVALLTGVGRMESLDKVIVAGNGKEQLVETRHVILATGSVPTRPPFLDFKDPRIITSDEALELRAIPSHATVLGAGAVGCEFASIFRSFGAEVLLVEMLDRLLPNEDREVSAELLRAFKRRKIQCRVSTRLEKAEPSDDGLDLLLTPSGGKPERVRTGLLLCAVGRSPYTTGLGAERLGVQFDQGFARTDPERRTTQRGVFAIGDIVSGKPLLAHAASAEGIVAAEVIAGKKVHPVLPHRIPSATYCDPEVASVGFTEEQAQEKGYRVKASKFPFAAIAKARILRATSGFCKIVAEERYGEVLGIHIIGPHATDLISEACVAIGLESTAADLSHVVHPHPTLSEGLMEAAHALTGGAIHI